MPQPPAWTLLASDTPLLVDGQDVGLSKPLGFTSISIREESHGGRPVVVERTQSGYGLEYGREHVTTVTGADDGILYGYTRQVPTTDIDRVPGTDAATRIAYDFLERVAPEYSRGLTHQWSDRHDETVRDADGTDRTVTGIKVKNYHSDGSYTWVIVGENGQIITYERGVSWDTVQGRRETSMWLHDTWITTRNEGGQELPAPNARLDAD